MDFKPMLPWLAKLLRALAFFSALVGTANAVLNLTGGGFGSAMTSLMYGAIFAATFWMQAVLVEDILKKK